jgi:NAD+ synthase (glutamine-hydrolysing)
MKIYIAQQNYHIGNFEFNTSKIIEAIKMARMAGADLVLFSELSICGYPPRDFLEFPDFIKKCNDAVKKICLASGDLAVLVGGPSVNPAQKGKDLFNSAFFIENGKVTATIHKTLLPTYDVFDEYRHFEPAHDWNIIHYKGYKLAITICEDIWNLGENPMYRTCPMDELMKQSPDIMLNLSASPFDYTHVDDRLAVIRANVKKYKLPMIYCNTTGSQTEIVFDGGSLVFDENANLIKSLPLFEEAAAIIEWSKESGFGIKPEIAEKHLPMVELAPATLIPDLYIERIHRALVSGIRDYFYKMGFDKAIIGSSGGIDSAVTLALACEALGADNVLAVLMPSPFSTEHSVSDAVQLSKNLANPYDIIAIKDIYHAFQETLKPLFKELPFSVAEENIQSRIRGNLLMAIANKFGYILLNTSNKSELATGYGTLYGDMAGGLGVLGDCYKMQVYEVAKYINRHSDVIPTSIIKKAPSAELRPGQKDSDSLPDYAQLDAILYQYIECRKGPDEIKEMGFDDELTDRVLRLVNMNEYKRNQFCPIIRVSPKAFGVGRRIPIVAKYLS